MATLLRQRGYEVAESTDGLDALKKVTASRFDAILLDLILPHVDGWQFRATQMRHPELARIPTVIVTVRPLLEPERYALRAEDIVHKPFEDADLLQAIQRACRLPQAPPTARVDAITDTSGLFWSRRGELPAPTTRRRRTRLAGARNNGLLSSRQQATGASCIGASIVPAMAAPSIAVDGLPRKVKDPSRQQLRKMGQVDADSAG